MPMTVMNNSSAMMALGELNKNNKALSKSLKKVASGMKINSAMDDASGYAISERMRVQIRSLDQDIQNTQNGSSMLKVAEGAAASTVEILKTLKEKALNAANDTNTEVDRATIQKEIDEQIDQVDDNALVTFNGKYLLDGREQPKAATVEAMIVNALNSEWLENSMNLISDTDGLSFTEDGTSVKDITVFLDHDPKDKDGKPMNALAWVTSTWKNSTGKTYKLELHVNMDYYQNLDEENVNGYDSVQRQTNLDRVIAHEMTHALMSANITKFGSLPQAVIEGSAEITHGIDDQRAGTMKGLIPGTLQSELTGTASGTQKTYAAGYMALRYMIKNGTGTGTDVMKRFMKILDRQGASGLDGAVSFATNGRFKSWNSMSESLVNDLTKAGGAVTEDFLEKYCDIVLPNKDTGAASGHDAGTTNMELDDDEIVPEGGSTRYWISPYSDTTIINGLTVHWPKEHMTPLGHMYLQTGTKANQNIMVQGFNLTSEGIGLRKNDKTVLQVTTREKASRAITRIDQAVQRALDVQTTIGSLESRLEYTAANLTVSSENVQGAESTIRDSDMAKEMTAYTKNNVLMQAAQSMLAQANQNSSSVLSLLQ